MARIKAVCISDKKGQPKTVVERIELKADYGIVGDAHAGVDTHRQVSLLDEAGIDIMRRKGYDAVAGDFGENIVTEQLPLGELGMGSILQVGEQVQLEISQIGKACHTPCVIGRRMGQCIMPTEGLFAVVLQAGIVQAGDEIRILQKVSRSTIQAAIITVSDRCSRGQTQDTSGPLLAQRLRENLQTHIAVQLIVPDEKEIITERLKQLCEPDRRIDLVLTTGGTGFAPRDVTPEATVSVIDRPAPGIAETIRAASLAQTPRAMLSRAAAGIRCRTLIINLPGSEKAVRQSLEVILPVLAHAVELLRGEVTDCGRNVPTT
jgi:molybdenum cofactor synthesis domain-containing protein